VHQLVHKRLWCTCVYLFQPITDPQVLKFHDQALMLHCENKTNKCMYKYMNSLHYNYCKPQSPVVAIFREICFYEGFITKTTKPLYIYKILSFKYVIPVSVQIWNTYKIIGAKFTWVGSVQVLCVLYHHTSKVVLLR
jgi:hypothetical protein